MLAMLGGAAQGTYRFLGSTNETLVSIKSSLNLSMLISFSSDHIMILLLISCVDIVLTV